MQFYAFFNMIVVGVIIALLFDFYNLILKKLDLAQAMVNFTDLFYSLLSFVIVLVFLYQANRIEIRYSVYLGFGLGFITYYKLIRGGLVWLKLKFPYLNE